MRLLGFGGMGEVYEAEDDRLQGVHIALKTILPHIASDLDLQKRFEREVLLAREVVHPNLCPIYDIFHSDDPTPGLLFLTMKLLPGQTLAARIRQPTSISTSDGVAILKQVALGLAAIHAAGIVHRDIKPTNIMIDGSGPDLHLWITDFGLARAYHTEPTVLNKSILAGTPAYIAPEVFRGHLPSQASDLFAFGVVLHEVFTGEKPTHVPDSSSCVVSPKLASPDVPQFCVELISGCLDSDPARRCQAFAQALAIIVPGGKHYPYEPSTGRLWTRRRFIAATAAGAGAIAATGAWWKWEDIEALVHPLPQKRFVALLSWPKTATDQLAPMLSGVLSTMKSQLSRVEAFDRNFFVVSPEDDQGKPPEITHLREVCDSLGANLVLAVSVLSHANDVQLFLHLLDPISGQRLREKSLRCALTGVTSLPNKAAEAAAALLNLRKYLQGGAAGQGTESPTAYMAFQAAEALTKTQPNDAQLDEAIEKYKQAIEIDPDYALAHAQLALAYANLYGTRHDPGALTLARANSDHSLALDPHMVAGHVSKAVVLEATGDEQGALNEFAKALTLDPSNTNTLLLQAQVYSRLDRWTEAEQSYQKILSLRPNSWVTYAERGYAFDQQGRYQDAVESYRTAAVAAPGNSFVLANLSGEYLQVGDFAAASEASKKSFLLRPNALAAANASLALRYQDKYREALPFAIKATELDPSDDINWLELGECYQSLGNHANEARAAYARAATEAERQLNVNAADGPRWMLLALYQIKSGHSQSALSLIKKAEEHGADDVDSQLSKARILELLGKRDEALSTLAVCFRRGATALQVAPFPDLQSLRKDPRYRQILPVNAKVPPEQGQ